MPLSLRTICHIEAATYLVLTAAVVWHRLGGGPDWVPILGLVHGIVFLVYLAAVLRARRGLGWDAQATVTALFAAAIPLGGFVIARRLPARPAV